MNKTLKITDKKWLDNYTIFMLFCTTEQRFPRASDKFNDVNIGNWFMNQRKLYRKNTLDIKKKELLDKISPLWSGDSNDLRLFENQIKAANIVNYAMENNQTPITELIGITRQELVNFSDRKLLTCELLLLSDNVDMDTKYRALAAIYKEYISLNYFKLLKDIRNFKSYLDLKNSVEFKKLKNNLDDALEMLTEDEKEIVTLYYGLETGEEMALRDVGDAIELSHERVRQILNKALDKLSSPGIYIGIICKESKLYAEAVEKINIETSNKNNSIKYDNNFENKPLYRFDKELTVTLVNTLMSNGYNTLGDIIRIDEDKIKNIPNLGPKSIDLLKNFIGKYVYLTK